MFRNVFGITVNIKDFYLEEETDYYPLTIGGIRKWIRDNYGIIVSKSNICSVRDKCGADKLETGSGRLIPTLKSVKEKAVLDAFKALGIFSMAEKTKKQGE